MIFSCGDFLFGLYHPRALAQELQQNSLGFSAAQLQLVLFSAGGWPYTTPDVWPYRVLFNGTSG